MRKSHKLAFLIAAAAILAFPLALAQAASAPTARTASATNVAATSATLRGTVNPNGEQTNYAFDWGTSTSYGQQTPATSAGSGTSAKDVSSALSGLSPGVTYHFRVTATNASGTAVGSDQTFTTHPAPNVATGGATSVSSSSAVVNGVVNPQGHRTTYFFQYGTSPSYGVQTTPGGAGSGTNNVAVHSTLTGLAPGTLYHYRLVAQNSGGTSTGSDATFTTTSSPTQSHVAFMGRMGFVSPGGIIGVEAGCFGGQTNCGGHVSMTRNGIVVGQRNFNIAPNSGGFQNLGLSAQGKQMLKNNRPFHLLAVTVTVTTDSGQRIQQVMRLARWVWH